MRRASSLRSAAHLDQMQDDFIAQTAGVAGLDDGGAPVVHAAVAVSRRPWPLRIMPAQIWLTVNHLY